jgi:cell division protein FtsB
MKKQLTLVIILALAMLVAVTPVLASSSSSQSQYQNQDEEQNGTQPQNQEQNGSEAQYQEKNEGETQSQEKNGAEAQNQEMNGEQIQNQEQNRHQLGEGSSMSGEPGSLAGSQIFALTGTLTGLGSSLTVEVHNGNRFVKPYVGETLEVLVTGATAYQAYTPSGCVPVDATALLAGASVSIQGTVSEEGVFTAQRVTVDAPWSTLPQ